MSPRFRFLQRLFPQSLGGQLLVMLLLALAVTQGLGLLMLTNERNRAVRAALGLEAAGRAANVALLLDTAPVDLRPSILLAADSPLVRFDIGPEPEAPDGSAGTLVRVALRGWIHSLRRTEQPFSTLAERQGA